MEGQDGARPELERVDRKVVLITGCSSGIGAALARLFARRGWNVFASMRDPEQGAGLRAEAAAAGWRLSTPALDVTDEEAVNRVVAGILGGAPHRIDAVINNAGFYCYGAIEDTTPAELQAQFDTNVLGILRVCRAVLPAMRARGDGAIVNLSSTSGRTALPAVGPYQISKFAVEALTETLRYEVAPFGVRVACIEPGPFETELHRKQIASAGSRSPDSPYADLIAVYRRRLAALPRAPLDTVAETIFAAATAADPALRWPVGTLSWMATVGRYLVPDRLFEWIVRLVFGTPRAR